MEDTEDGGVTVRTDRRDEAVAADVRSVSAPPGRGGRPRHLVCFSHLRWAFVHQRPQHLMTRFAREYQVFFVEEPVVAEAAVPSLEVRRTDDGVWIVVPRIPAGTDPRAAQRSLLDDLFAGFGLVRPILWYYTPMSLAFSDHLPAAAVVYDCMDELSAFQGAPPALRTREDALLARADLVFTGGHSLYLAKRQRHHCVHAFPSGVDVGHFAAARGGIAEAADQAGLARPRLGFYGVLDERLDRALLAAVAARRPDWQFVLLGPVAKIDPESLPRAPNLHYLGPRPYAALPSYLAGWEVALMPFALNAATRFISPTKTPEYLAAGRPVVATPVPDVVRAYGDTGLVALAATPAAFVAACERAIAFDRTAPRWLAAVDRALADMSWDATWRRMKGLIECVI